MVVSGGGAFVGAIGFRGLCAKRAERSPTRARGAAHSPIVPLLICPRPLRPPSVLPADDDATAGPPHRRRARGAARRDPPSGRTGLPGPPQEGAEHLARAVGAVVSFPLRGADVAPGHRPCE